MSSVSGVSSCVSEAQQASLASQVQMSVYAKQLQAQKQAGEAVNQLLAGILQLSKEAGKGSEFDAVA